MRYKTYRFVKLICPKSKRLAEIFTSKIPVLKQDSIYGTVNFFRDKIFLKSEFEAIEKKIIGKNKIDFELRDIINLHNEDGLDITKIKFMFEQIKSGLDILSDCRLPNVKLVKIVKGKLVLFDGHHTLLAYMLAGRKKLSEVSHLIIDGPKGIPIEEIYVFFGKHSDVLKNKNWRNYVINWYATEKEQLCRRKRKNIGELFDVIRGSFS